jgi:phage host-nuclease inhibitor protein Gam
MAKRIKKTEDLYTVLTFEQVDTHLAKIGQLQRERETAEAEADRIINTAKEILKQKSAEIEGKIQKHLRSLEAFCGQNREDFGPAKSRKLLFGAVGWRKSTSITISKKTTLAKILGVFGRAAGTYIRIKQEVDKEALAKLSDGELKRVDAKRVVKDDFYAEPDLAACANYGREPKQ